jgi:catechol 2,3-dioxygenase-like lactoylglutathione lyase family enzyme
VAAETGGTIAGETTRSAADETARTVAAETGATTPSETTLDETASDPAGLGETAPLAAGETVGGTIGGTGRPTGGNGARSGAVGPSGIIPTARRPESPTGRRPESSTARRPEGALPERESAPRQGAPLRPEAAPEVLFEAVAEAAPAAFIKPTAFPEPTLVPGPRTAAEQTPGQTFNDGHAAVREPDDMPTARVTAIELDLGDLITAYPSARPGPAGSIHGVGITMLVTDLARSIAFYRDMLGFAEIDGGDGNAVLASGDTRIVLRSARDVPRVNRRLVHLNLEVGDVNAVYQELRSKGVRFTYPPRAANRGERLELWAAAFRDPDGHGIAITQWRNRTA